MVSLPNITLEAEEADRFIDYIVDESVLKNNARIIKMQKQSKNIRPLGLGSNRFLYPGDGFSASDYLATLSDDLIVLSSKKLRGCLVVHDDDLEDSPDGDAFMDHLMKMVAKKIANEIEEIFWIGDTADVSGFAATDARSKFDGWHFILDNSQSGETYENDVEGSCTILDAANATTDHDSDFVLAGRIAMVDGTAPYNWEFKFNQMIRSLPSKYKKIAHKDLRFFCNDLVLENYLEALESRATILGDNAILGDGPLHYHGIPIISAPLMSSEMAAATDSDKCKLDEATPGTYSDVVLTHKDNFIIGIQRDIKVETQREASDESTYVFFSLRMDTKIENVNAAVLLKRVTTTGVMIA